MDQLIEKLKKEPMMRYAPTLEEIEQICQTYEIGHWLKTEGELGGLFNVNLKIVTTTGTYVIRVHSGLSRQNHLEAEHRLLQTLSQRGLPVLAPLSTKQETNYIQLHGRFAQLTPFVEGTAFGYLPQQIHSSAVILRKFHDVLVAETEIPAPFWSNYPAHQVLQEGMDKLNLDSRLLITRQAGQPLNYYKFPSASQEAHQHAVSDPALRSIQ